MVTVLERFVVEQVGHVELLDRTRQTATSRVLHVRDTDGRRWFAKRLTRQWSYRAEASAYDVWGHLPQVPRLRASCADRRCLLLPAVPGRRPSGQDLRVLRRAGALLRTLHEAPAPAAWHSEWREVARDVTERRLGVLDSAGVAVDAGLVREHLDELLALADLPEVPTHGDFQPHNWRWHRGRLHTFDFAGAALRPAAYDLSRLRYAACWHDPGLFDRLLAGYGRDLTSDEQRFLVAALPWRALVALCVGTRFGRPRMVDHAHRVLDSLAAGRHWGDR